LQQSACVHSYVLITGTSTQVVTECPCAHRFCFGRL